MLNAAQYQRQFFARVISLIYLLLMVIAFGQEPGIHSETKNAHEISMLAGVHTGGFSKAILTVDSERLDDLPTPLKEPKQVSVFSPAITNHFFNHQWKQCQIECLTGRTPVKRYLLFSCLRLSEEPSLA